MDVGPLERKDEIGEFESLALITNKNFKLPKKDKRDNDEIISDIDEKEQE